MLIYKNYIFIGNKMKFLNKKMEIRDNESNNIISSQKNETENTESKCSMRQKIIIIIIISVIVVAWIIIGIVLGIKSDSDSSDSSDDNNSYYLSEKICETIRSTEVCYRKINVNYEHYIFELSEEVTRTHVTYKNRYGIIIAADLYTPKNLDTNNKYRALVIGPLSVVLKSKVQVYILMN